MSKPSRFRDKPGNKKFLVLAFLNKFITTPILLLLSLLLLLLLLILLLFFF